MHNFLQPPVVITGTIIIIIVVVIVVVVIRRLKNSQCIIFSSLLLLSSFKVQILQHTIRTSKPATSYCKTEYGFYWRQPAVLGLLLF